MRDIKTLKQAEKELRKMFDFAHHQYTITGEEKWHVYKCYNNVKFPEIEYYAIVMKDGKYDRLESI